MLLQWPDRCRWCSHVIHEVIDDALAQVALEKIDKWKMDSSQLKEYRVSRV